MDRNNIVALARTWLGTPYHHQASCKGVGTDCLGLVRGVYRELYGREAETPPPYSSDWAEAARRETLLEAARRHLIEISREKAQAGDVVIFRLRPQAMAKHAAILTGPRRMIHAFESGVVCEVPMCGWWSRRVATAFSFPEVV